MHQHLKDAIHICHPATITTVININIIRDIPRKDAIYTISQLVWTTNLSLARIHEFWKKSSSSKANTCLMGIAFANIWPNEIPCKKSKLPLKLYSGYRKKLFTVSETRDEIWVYHFQPNWTRSNRSMGHQSTKHPTIVQNNKHGEKDFICIFFPIKLSHFYKFKC